MGSKLSNCFFESNKSADKSDNNPHPPCSFLDPKAFPSQRHASLKPEPESEKTQQNELFLSRSTIKRSRSYTTELTEDGFRSGRFNKNQNNAELSSFTILREFDTDNVYKGKRYLVARKKHANSMLTMTNCKKSLIKQQQSELFLIQRQVYESNNPFISKLLYLIENKTTLFVFQAYFSGLDLAFQLQKTGFFKEKIARFYLAEMVLALEGLPDSLLLQNSLIYYLDMKSMLVDRDGHLNMNIVSPVLRATKKLGSSMDERYNPPELFLNEKSTHSAVFAWKLGVFLYEMLAGRKPFQNRKEVLENSALLQFPAHKFNIFTVDFIKKLLQREPQKRLGSCEISEVKTHEFFSGLKWSDILEKKSIGPLAISSKEENKLLDQGLEGLLGLNPGLYEDHNILENAEDIMGEIVQPYSTAEKTSSFLSNVNEEEDQTPQIRRE